MGEGQEQAEQCVGMTPACLHRAAQCLYSAGDGWIGMRVGHTSTGSDSHVVLVEQCGGVLPFD
jgi:hypothetical protein